MLGIDTDQFNANSNSDKHDLKQLMKLAKEPEQNFEVNFNSTYADSFSFTN